MEAVCEDRKTEKSGTCKTVFIKDCSIIMKEVWTSVINIMCGVGSIQQYSCVEGERKSCIVR